MLTTNADISDRLMNGQLGYTYNFATNIGTATQICIKFDDNAACLKAIQNESLAKTHNAVPYIYNQTNSVSYYAGICLHHAQSSRSYIKNILCVA